MYKAKNSRYSKDIYANVGNSGLRLPKVSLGLWHNFGGKFSFKNMKEMFDVLNELGEFTGEVATRDECHEKGLWHRAVYAFIIDDNFNVLLQKRSANKKLWPNKWDVTIGGHVNAGEFGRQALIRECKEELGIEISDDDIKYIVEQIKAVIVK